MTGCCHSLRCILVLGAMCCTAVEAAAQEVIVTLLARRVTVREAIQAMERQTEYRVVVNWDDMAPDRQVTLWATTLSVGELMAGLLSGTGFTHRVMAGRVVITPREMGRAFAQVRRAAADAPASPAVAPVVAPVEVVVPVAVAPPVEVEVPVAVAPPPVITPPAPPTPPTPPTPTEFEPVGLPPFEPLAPTPPTPRRPSRPSRRLALTVGTNLPMDAVAAPNFEIGVPLGRGASIAAEWVFPWWLIERRQWALQLMAATAETRWWPAGRAKEQMTGWFVGAYGGAGLYDVEWGTEGRQGEFFHAGLSGGFVHPVGRRTRMEYSIGLGYLETRFRQYEPRKNDGEWHLIRRQNGRAVWIGPTRARVSLVVAIGGGGGGNGGNSARKGGDR